jgi:hypothetical protein
MTANTALVPLEERRIDFHGDTLTAVLVAESGREPTIYVPVRPLCEYLGLSWGSQRNRIMRDPVLSVEAKGVFIMNTPSASGRGGGRQSMLALPLEFLHGWLFGVDASRARPELREKLTSYRRECFRVLWSAFRADAVLGRGPRTTAEARDVGLAVARQAEQQLADEDRLATTEVRLDRAAAVVGDLARRLTDVEHRLTSGERISEAQAAEISQAVKALAAVLTERGQVSGRTPYQAVFGELYRRFGVTSYKNVPADRFNEVMAFLDEWRREAAG